MTTDVGSFKSYQLSEGRTTPVSVRVSPTEKIRAEIDALFGGDRKLGEVIEDVARLGARLIIQTALDAEGEQFEAWRNRPLDGVVLDYLFLDASMFKMHPGARPEPVLAAWGIDTEGKPVFVALAAGGSESTDAWGDFLDELRGRGLRPPLLVISDGAAGLINAIESALPRSLRQKCLIHRCRNVLAKVPATAQDEIRAAYWEIFDTAELTAVGIQPGQRLVT